MSCSNPGTVSCPERTAPPGSGCSSHTRTSSPASASMFAATSPFGPAPMTMTSLTRGRRPLRSIELLLLHAPGQHVNAVDERTADLLCDAFDDRGPHVELNLLRHSQPVVHQRRQPVTAARPRLDGEVQMAVSRPRSPLDLAGLEVAVERREAEAIRPSFDDADGAIPGAGHAHDELVADRQLPLVSDGLPEPREPRRGDHVRVRAQTVDQLLGPDLRTADRG